MLKWGAILLGVWLVATIAERLLRRGFHRREARRLLRPLAGADLPGPVWTLMGRLREGLRLWPRWLSALSLGIFLVGLVAVALLFAAAFAWASGLAALWARLLALYVISGMLITFLQVFHNGIAGGGCFAIVLTLVAWPLVAYAKLAAPFPAYSDEEDEDWEDEEEEEEDERDPGDRWNAERPVYRPKRRRSPGRGKRPRGRGGQG